MTTRSCETLSPSNPAKYQVKRGTRGVQIVLEFLYQKQSTNGGAEGAGVEHLAIGQHLVLRAELGLTP